jgi:hypothetical protein
MFELQSRLGGRGRQFGRAGEMVGQRGSLSLVVDRGEALLRLSEGETLVLT